jgi:deoxyribose-phosphate aldolase
MIGDHMTNDNSTAIAQVIDHNLLNHEETRYQIDRLCREAIEYHFASVCVNPTLSAAAGWAKVCTVVGFPLGATTTAVKAYETRQAIGATEIDGHQRRRASPVT